MTLFCTRPYILGVSGRRQEVSDCCPPPLSPVTELLFGTPRCHGFDDEAQDG